jgi:hypothetical protein
MLQVALPQAAACLATAASMLAKKHACLLQLEATIAEFPNFLPFNFAVQQGTLRGLTNSLARRSQGSTADAGQLRTATDFRGSLSDGGLLQVTAKGTDAMTKVHAAHRDDVAMAAAIIADESNSSMLPQRKEYCLRHQLQVSNGSFDPGYALLEASLVEHCKRVRELRAANNGEWYVVLTWGKSTWGGMSTSDRMQSDRICLQYCGYRCATVPESMLSTRGTSNQNGFQPEQVEEWLRNGAVQTARGGGSEQAAKPGSKRPEKPCPNWWCGRGQSGANYSRHVKDCNLKGPPQSGEKRAEPKRRSVTEQKARVALKSNRGF